MKLFKSQEILIKNTRYTVKVAENPITRAWGLSLQKKGKMLFKFRKPTKAAIDMALLSKKLHLYFIDEQKKVIHTEKAHPWTWNPKTWKIYRPNQKYKYLLESFQPLEIKEGDKIEI